MKTSWPIIALKDIIIQTKNIVEINPLQSYKQITVKLNHKGVILRCEILGKEIKSKQYLAPKNHFIISRIDARNGAMGIIPNELNNSIVTNDFPIFAINDSKLNLKYFNYMTSTEWFVHICKVASEGTTNRVRLNIDKFLKIEIPLPSLEEQKRIVEKIDFIAKKVEEVRALREEAIKEAEELFISELKYIVKLLVEKSMEVWEKGKLINLGTWAIGNGFPLAYQGFEELDYLFCKVGDMNLPGNEVYIKSTENTIDDSIAKKIKVKIHPPGTVIFPKIGGAIATNKRRILTMPTAIDNNCLGIIPNQDIIPKWLYYILRSINLEQYQSGTSVPAVRQSVLEEIEVPIIPKDIQEKIVSYLDSLQDKIDELKKLQIGSEKEIEELIPSILDKAFKGEL